MSDARDDPALAEAVRGGDHAAWAELARRQAPALAAYLGARLRRPAVVLQLLEETIIQAWRKRDELVDPADAAGWLRRIGAAVAKRWHRDHPDEPIAERFPEALAGGDRACNERMARLEDALGRLGDAPRMALEARFRGGLEGAALAAVLHLPGPEAAQRAVDEALAQLARELAP